MDFELVNKMKVEELKTYLRLRGLKVSGRKVELVARVFAASENNVQPLKTAEEVEAEIADEYKAKLSLKDFVLPDPFHIKDGWIEKEKGVTSWPMVLYPDIYNYLNFNPSELSSADLCDYKNCKAYRYFKRGWLGPLQYHKVQPDCDYCLLKTDCTPSERLSDTPHKLWICMIKKDAKNMTAHCTCMAGMSATCNHVGAALFRIEAAVRLALSNPSCTSKPNELLPNRKDVKPVKIKNLCLSRDDFGKRGKHVRPLVSAAKKTFNPITTEANLDITAIAEKLEDDIPDSILFTAVPKPKIDQVRDYCNVNCPEKPKNLLSMADILSMTTTLDDYHQQVKAHFKRKDISEIKKLTRGQNNNEQWFAFRKGVVTGSKAHEVKTKMTKFTESDGSSTNLWSLFKKVSGMTFVNPNIPALKYGREMEINAANKFQKMHAISHKNIKVEECGLFLLPEKPFIGCIPDRIVFCCCGKSCLEIKCPYSINYTSPTDPKVTL